VAPSAISCSPDEADALLLGYLLLDAAGCPTPPAALLARGSWSAQQLLEHLALATGVPLPQLALARPPPACSGLRTLSQEQLGGLAWDEESVLTSRRVDAPPFQLCDGELLVVRDRLHPPPLHAPPPRVHEGGVAGRRGTGAGKGSIRFADGAAEVAEFPRTSLAAPGLHIRTHMDEARY